MSGVAVLSESARPPDKCVQRRSVSGGAGTAGAIAGRTPTHLSSRSGRLSSHRHTRHDKTAALACRSPPPDRPHAATLNAKQNVNTL